MKRVLDMTRLRFCTWEKLGHGYPMLLQQSTIFMEMKLRFSKEVNMGVVILVGMWFLIFSVPWWTSTGGGCLPF